MNQEELVYESTKIVYTREKLSIFCFFSEEIYNKYYLEKEYNYQELIKLNNI